MLISNTNVTFKYERYLFLQQTASHSMPVETIIETWWKSIFKDEIYSC